MNEKKWNQIVIGSMAVIVVIISVFTIVIDPFFHYHAPLDALEYPMEYERYQNDGISRNFDYNIIVTGTSMTQNFHISRVNELWGGTGIKIPFAGGSFREIDEAVQRALSYNSNVNMVIRSLDNTKLAEEPDSLSYEGYPSYLYDNNPFNDISYLLNKEVMTKSLAVINYTRSGKVTPTFDDYMNWSKYSVFGEEAVFNQIPLFEQVDDTLYLSDDVATTVKSNIQKNIIETAENNPKVTFYLFFPPYSICFWGAQYRTGQEEIEYEIQKIAMEEILQVPNIKLYSFMNAFDITCDLENYMDALHYSEWVNQQMLEWMCKGDYLITKENYVDYLKEIREFYGNYDYNALYEGK